MTSKEKVLAALGRNDLTKREVAEVTGLSKSYAAEIVNKLVYAGEISRVDVDPSTGAEVFGLPIELEEPETCVDKGECIF